MKLVKLLDRRPYGTKGQKVRWAMFECGLCGDIVERRINNGKSQKSCGCNQHPARHGKSHTPLYRRWSSMIQRCTNENAPFFERYGGRGITVCNEWRDFAAFEAWALGNGYKRELMIDRIDNDGNYEPSNCRFISQKENVINSTSTKLSDALAAQIREYRSKTRESYEKIAVVFGISGRTVYDVIKGVRWQHE